MKPLKRLLKSPAFQRRLVKLLAGYIRLVHLTAHKRFDIHPDAAVYMSGEQNAIFSFWHGRMMMLPAISPPRRPMNVLISHHRDGVLISDVIARFNQRTVSGSSSKGGRAALTQMVRLLKEGDNLSITPDGPRGPNQVAASGVATLARLSGKAVLPVTFSAKWHKRMHSWDRFMVALPFTRVVFYIGAPIMVDKNTDIETGRLAIEIAMNQLVEKADAAIL